MYYGCDPRYDNGEWVCMVCTCVYEESEITDIEDVCEGCLRARDYLCDNCGLTLGNQNLVRNALEKWEHQDCDIPAQMYQVKVMKTAELLLHVNKDWKTVEIKNIYDWRLENGCSWSKTAWAEHLKEVA